jgi:hypothetical protein
MALRGGARESHFNIVGQFHLRFRGRGRCSRFRARMPSDEGILVISLQRADGTSLREEDRGRAVGVIYTGKSRRGLTRSVGGIEGASSVV